MIYGSIYGTNRVGVSEGTFNPDYATPDAPARMALESIELDQKFFDLMVEHDFLECAASTSVELESALMAVDESFLSDVWEKIVELIKKIKDKVVSIFKAAAVKVGAFFTKDNAALVEKYQRQFNNADHSKIEIKGFREMDGDPVDIIRLFNPDQDFKGVLGETIGKKEVEKIKKNYTVEKKLKEVITNYSGGSLKAENMKIFKPARDMKASAISSKITTALTNHQGALKQIDDCKKDAEEKLKTMEQAAQDYKDRVDEKDKKGGFDNTEGSNAGNEERQLENAKVEAARHICTITNTCIGKLSGLALDCIKFNIKQCRAAYIKIASKGAPNVHESAELLEAMIDADEYEVDSFFEQYSYDYEELTA